MIQLELIAVPMRLPLKFGAETVHSIQIAHVELKCRGVSGIGETPLSAGWAWPSAELSFAYREKMMCEFCRFLTDHYPAPEPDPLTSGYDFLRRKLPELRERFNREKRTALPLLAALICSSAFDLAAHDAFGKAHGLPIYQMYRAPFLRHDLAWFFQDDRFDGKYPQDYLVPEPPPVLPVWHLVGGRDLLYESERTGAEPEDGYPVTLEKWIERDGLKCLKIKLTGRDSEWDFSRLLAVGKIARKYGCDALSPDFNCQVRDPDYVNRILDRLKSCDPVTHHLLLYVEQPFPCELEADRIDVHSCSERKPLFMDESAHDWQHVRLGRELGWTGVALKVCKTQTGALLSACWAKEHGMQLMVQDLTNPMLAMLPHVLLAQQIGTIRGVECNAPQFYPEASRPFERKYPGLYERRGGVVDLRSIQGPGFGC